MFERYTEKARRVIFCEGDLYDAHDRHLASSRCTQIVLPSDGARG